MIEGREVVHDDGDRERHDQDPGDAGGDGDTHPDASVGRHVSVAHGGHGDQGPPVGVEHGVELRVCDAVLLKDEGQGGEDQDPDGEKENE